MHARSFSTKTHAGRWVQDMEADLRRGDWIDPRRDRTTFETWAKEYLTTIVHLRNVTRVDYERVVRVHLLPAFGRTPVANIEQVDVRRFLAEKQAAGLAPKTLQKIRLVLRQVLETARGSGAIRANPCEGLKLPRAQQKDPIFLTPAQVEQLARSARSPYGSLIRFAVATGLRPSEVCGLRLGRLNLRNGSVEVSEALTVVKGRTEVGPTKNGARRTVSVPRYVCDELRRVLDERAAGLGRGLTPEDYVFTAPQGGPLRRDLLHKRVLRPAVIEAGLNPGLRMHDLRHTCASILISLGAHPKVIQEWLGHQSIMVTMDVYGHLFPSLNTALGQRLEALLRSAQGEDDGKETKDEDSDVVQGAGDR